MEGKMENLKRINKEIREYLDKYDDNLTWEELLRRIVSNVAEDEKEKFIVTYRLVNILSRDSDLTILENGRVVRKSSLNFAKCYKCPYTYTKGENYGDMFDSMSNLSIFCEKLQCFVCQDVTLEETYQIDNSDFCPLLKKK